jgi:DNA-binding transcriptional ArsR family regulator
MKEQLDQPKRVAQARARLNRPRTQRGLENVQRIFCEPVRLRLFQALDEGPMSVGDLAATVDRKVQATSQHLRVMRELGVVDTERQGRRIYYRLTPTTLVHQLRGMLDSAERGAICTDGNGTS